MQQYYFANWLSLREKFTEGQEAYFNDVKFNFKPR